MGKSAVQEISLRLLEPLQLGNIRSRTMDSETVLQAIVENLVNCIQRVPGELGISQSSMVCYFHYLGIWIGQIVLHITKILQNFWLTPVC